MTYRQFEPFTTEVLNRGALAVLPQNLPERWLNALPEEAEVFQGILQQEDANTNIEETCAGLLGAVLVMLMQQSGDPSKLEMALSTLLRSMNYYVITLSAETISRKTDSWVEPPTLENLVSEDRVVQCMRKFIAQ